MWYYFNNEQFRGCWVTPKSRDGLMRVVLGSAARWRAGALPSGLHHSHLFIKLDSLTFWHNVDVRNQFFVIITHYWCKCHLEVLSGPWARGWVVSGIPRAERSRDRPGCWHWQRLAGGARAVGGAGAGLTSLFPDAPKTCPSLNYCHHSFWRKIHTIFSYFIFTS